MRIIAGKYKGKNLFSPKGYTARPTSDMVRESIFNIIQSDVYGARVLDLFAGSGAMGIEALSRDAKEVTFCDKEKSSLDTVRKNLDAVGEAAKHIIKGDFETTIKSLEGMKYDIIFLDPPYSLLEEKKRTEKLFNGVAKLLEWDGLCVFEYETGRELPEIPSKLEIVKYKKYGKTSLAVFGLKGARNEQ